MASPTPQSLDATLYNGNTQIKITWTLDTPSAPTVIDVCRNTTGNPTDSDVKIGSTNWPDAYYIDTPPTAGVTYYYRARSMTTGFPYSGYSNQDSQYFPTSYTDSTSDTLALIESTLDSVSIGASASDTVTLTEAETIVQALTASDSDAVTVVDSTASLATVTLETDYRYYFGSYDGKVYSEDVGFTSDDTHFIDSYWISKDTDFADEYQMYLNKFLSIYDIKLWYVDLSANTNVTISVS